ncbi:MAG: DUF192 domain-containing protein [Candidatus Staskawiczbacteria bacterium]|nr:DUF192 domain-containing protein [Candidatus Staskawiczbacteria bacterium]
MRFFSKYNKVAGVLLFLVLLAGVLFFVFTEDLNAPGSSNETKNIACIKDACFSVELADTNEERELGLMYRTQLDKNRGMLFVFGNKGIYPFWMKNTLIPLDIIWINNDLKVVFINENSQPCPVEGECISVNPEVSALYVLEINAGLSKELGIKIGDTLDIKSY